MLEASECLSFSFFLLLRHSFMSTSAAMRSCLVVEGTAVLNLHLKLQTVKLLIWNKAEIRIGLYSELEHKMFSG